MFLLELILNIVYLYIIAIFIIIMVFAIICIPIALLIAIVNFVGWLTEKIVERIKRER